MISFSYEPPSLPSHHIYSFRMMPSAVSLRADPQLFPNSFFFYFCYDISYATAITPELTTIAQPIAEIGETIMQLLLTQTHDPASAPEVVVLEPTLIERESCREEMTWT